MVVVETDQPQQNITLLSLAPWWPCCTFQNELEQHPPNPQNIEPVYDPFFDGSMISFQTSLLFQNESKQHPPILSVLSLLRQVLHLFLSWQQFQIYNSIN